MKTKTNTLSKLIQRQKVTFDANDTDHRYYFHKFLTEGRWGNCPYSFQIKGVGNPVALMQTEILRYYSNKEFS